LAYITSDPVEPAARARWTSLLGHRQTWAFAIAKFMTDPIWWLYLFWIPDFFSRQHGLSLGELGLPIVTIYLVADIGSVGGGWLSSSLIRRGWSVNASRKTAMLGCALAVVPIMFAPHVASVWDGRPTSSRFPPTCFRDQSWGRWLGWAEPPAPSAACSSRS
jgi:ACS family hexuronate transporter-like MFS transporter